MSVHTTPAHENEQVEYRDLAPLGFPGYRVGSDGSVWTSIPHAWQKRGKGLVGPWRPMKPGRASNGYLTVNLNRTSQCVHSLVLKAFAGPPPAGMVCRHLDSNQTNNRLDNLCWGTRKQNAQDAVLAGAVLRGESHPSAKLTEQQVRQARRLYATGRYSLRQLGEMLGVHGNTIGKCVALRRWTHVAE